MNRNLEIAIACGATAVVVTALCWLAWRWRKQTISNRDWLLTMDRNDAVVAQNDRLREEADAARREADLLPLLRATLHDREQRFAAMSQQAETNRAREIGADTRGDRLATEVEELRQARRDLERQKANAEERAHQAETRLRVLEEDLRAASASTRSALSPAAASATDATATTAAAAATSGTETGTETTTGADNITLVDLRSNAEVARLERLLDKRSEQIDTMQEMLDATRARADAASILASDLRSQLDAQTNHSGQLEAKLRQG
jgi:hypothetical protein